MSAFADLLVKMDIDSARFRAELNQVGNELGKFGERISKAAEQLAHIFEVEAIKEAGEKLFEFIESGAEAADKMGKLAQSVGVPTQELSRLAYAAKLSDVSNEQLGSSLEKLSKNMLDASKGTGAQADAFAALGIKVTDSQGRLRSASDVFAEIAQRFSGFQDGATKAALAQELFGKTGAELIPLLNQGAAGLKDAGDEAERLGLVIGKEAAEKAEIFNDNLTRMKSVSQGMAIELASQLTPALGAVTDQFIGAAKNGGALKGAMDTVAAGGKLLINVGQSIALVFDVLGKSWGALAASLVAAASGDFRGAVRIIQDGYADIRSDTTDTFEAIAKTWESGADRVKAEAPEVAEKAAAPIIRSGDEIRKAADKAKHEAEQALKELQRTLVQYQQEVATFGGTDVDKLHFRLDSGDLADALKKAGPAAADYKQKILDAAMAVQQLKDEEQAAADAQKRQDDLLKEAGKVFDETRTPVERFNEEIARLNQLRDTFVDGKPLIDADTYQRAVRQAQDTLKEASKTKDELSEYAREAARNIQDSFADFLLHPLQHGFKDLERSFLEMLARMAAQLAASQIIQGFGKALQGGGGIWADIGNAIVGSRAGGGPVQPGGLYRVNEEGPELLTVGHDTYLMAGGDGGFVSPLNGPGQIASGASSNVVTVNVNVETGRTDITGQDAQQLGVAVSNAVKAELVKQRRPGGILATA